MMQVLDETYFQSLIDTVENPGKVMSDLLDKAVADRDEAILGLKVAAHGFESAMGQVSRLQARVAELLRANSALVVARQKLAADRDDEICVLNVEIRALKALVEKLRTKA